MSESIRIPCPKCGSELKLKDRSLLGRRGKCPRCEHRFVLEEPDEVELELVSAPVPGSTPAVGTEATYVPDTPTAPSANPNVPANSGVPVFAPEEPAFPTASSTGSRKSDRRKRKKKKQGKMIQIVAGGVAALAMVAGYFLFLRDDAPPKQVAKSAADAATTTRVEATTNENGEQVQVEYTGAKPNAAWEGQKAAMAEAFQNGQAASPTQGPAIDLPFIPAANLVIHLRPAELWSPTQQMQEFRNCLTANLTGYLEQTITELTKFPPAEIEEFTLAVIMETPQTPVQYAGLVRLKTPARQSELITKFGARNDDFGYPVYFGGDYAYAIDNENLGPDEQGRMVRPTTFAFAPKLRAGEMVDARKGSFGIYDDMRNLLKASDRDRHFTAVFQPQDLKNFQEFLVGENLRPAMTHFLDWFSPEVSAVSWSMHLGDPGARGKFFSEMLLKNRPTTTPPRLQREIVRNMKPIAPQLVEAVKKMTPNTQGYRSIIGRFPAMVESFRMNTLAGVSNQFVQLTTKLPERAGPNLAVGMVLTWDESTRTDFSADVPVVVAQNDGPALPETVAERLKMPIDIEFNRTPLQEAYGYIAETLKLNVEIDGDALKFAGMTKNMPQTFKLGTVPATDAIQQILNRYAKEEMVVAIDEAQKKFIVTTKTFAEKNKQAIYLSPAPAAGGE